MDGIGSPPPGPAAGWGASVHQRKTVGAPPSLLIFPPCFLLAKQGTLRSVESLPRPSLAPHSAIHCPQPLCTYPPHAIPGSIYETSPLSLQSLASFSFGRMPFPPRGGGEDDDKRRTGRTTFRGPLSSTHLFSRILCHDFSTPRSWLPTDCPLFFFAMS